METFCKAVLATLTFLHSMATMYGGVSWWAERGATIGRRTYETELKSKPCSLTSSVGHLSNSDGPHTVNS